MSLNQNFWLTIFSFTILTIIFGIIFIRLFNPRSLMTSLVIIYFFTPIFLVSIPVFQTSKSIFQPEISALSLTLTYLTLICFTFLHFAIDKTSISMEILQFLQKRDRNRQEIQKYIKVNFQNDNRIQEILNNSFFLKEKKLKSQIRFLLFIWRLIAPVRLDREQ